MLSQADNELLTRVGPGTPMGNFMRQYWLPAMLADELPAPDCPPVRIRLLGENLIASLPHMGRTWRALLAAFLTAPHHYCFYESNTRAPDAVRRRVDRPGDSFPFDS